MAEPEVFRVDMRHFLPDRPDLAEGIGTELALNTLPVHSNWREIRAPLSLNSVALTHVPNVGGDPLEVVEGVPTDLIGHYYHVGAASSKTDIIHLTHAGTRSIVSLAGSYAGSVAFRFMQFGSSKIIASSIEHVLQLRTGAGNFANITYSSTRTPQFHFIGQVRSRVVGAYEKEGATYFPHRFSWSAADDETEWDAVSGGPGFVDIKDDAGSTTGLICFEEFAVLFKEKAVHRLQFVGGSDGFQRVQIGGAPDGKDFFVQPIPYGRDVYYMSRSGFRVVRNGQAIESIVEGATDRFFIEGFEKYHRDPNLEVRGALSTHYDLVCFVYNRLSDVVVPARPYTEPILATYHVRSGRWAVTDLRDWIDIEDTTTLRHRTPLILAHNEPGVSSLLPLDDILFIAQTNTDELALRVDSAITATTLAQTYRSHTFEIKEQLTSILGVRPVFQWNHADLSDSFEGTNAPVDTGGTPPAITVKISYGRHWLYNLKATDASNPTLDVSTWTGTTAAANWNRGGFIRQDLPIVGRAFKVEVTIPAMPSGNIKEFSGVDLLVVPAGRGGA